MKNQEKGKKGDETPWNEVWEKFRDEVYAPVHREFDNMTEHEGRILAMATWEAWKLTLDVLGEAQPDTGREERRFRAAVAAMQALLQGSNCASLAHCKDEKEMVAITSVMMAEELLDKLEEFS